MKKSTFIFSLLWLSLIFVNAQEVKIKVNDLHSGEAVPFANICTETLSTKQKEYKVTDLNGQVVVPISQKTIISISCMGYKSISDTLLPDVLEKVYALEIFQQELNEVVVTGQYKPVSADKSIYSIKIIGKDKIDSKAAVNLAGILSDEPSIRISNSSATGTSMSLQGIPSENIKILIDGVPVIGRLDGNIDLSQLNLNNVSHIEIIEGPMSVIYGSNALGGVVNIITNKNSQAKYKTSLTSYYENVGIYNFGFLTSVRDKKHTFELSGSRNFFAGYSYDTTPRSKEWKPKEQYDAGINYYYNATLFNLQIKSDFFRERLLDQTDAFAPYYEEANNTWYKTLRFNNSAGLSGTIGTNSNFNILAAYSFYNRSKAKYRVDLTDLSQRLTTQTNDHDTSVFDAVVLRGVYSYSPDKNRLNVQSGFDINLETSYGKRIENKFNKIGDYALFANVKWNILKNLVFQPGVRAAYNTMYSTPLTSSVHLLFNPGKTTFRASWARGFRAPSLKELYLHFYDSNHQIEGNEDLNPESWDNFTLSASQNLSYRKTVLLLDLKTYYNHIENRIYLIQVDPQNPLHYRYDNTGTYESLGMELTGTFYFGSRIKFKSGYSRIGIKDEIYKNRIYNFNDNLSSSLNINFLKNTANFAIFYKYSGKYPVYYYNASDEIVSEFANSFQTLDISVGKKFWENRILLATGIKNIFDNKEIGGISSGGHGTSDGVSSMVGWGRTFFIDLKFNITKY